MLYYLHVLSMHRTPLQASLPGQRNCWFNIWGSRMAEWQQQAHNLAEDEGKSLHGMANMAPLVHIPTGTACAVPSCSPGCPPMQEWAEGWAAVTSRARSTETDWWESAQPRHAPCPWMAHGRGPDR